MGRTGKQLVETSAGAACFQTGSKLCNEKIKSDSPFPSAACAEWLASSLGRIGDECWLRAVEPTDLTTPMTVHKRVLARSQGASRSLDRGRFAPMRASRRRYVSGDLADDWSGPMSTSTGSGLRVKATRSQETNCPDRLTDNASSFWVLTQKKHQANEL